MSTTWRVARRRKPQDSTTRSAARRSVTGNVGRMSAVGTSNTRTSVVWRSAAKHATRAITKRTHFMRRSARRSAVRKAAR
jgi:hypothetical protein